MVRNDVVKPAYRLIVLKRTFHDKHLSRKAHLERYLKYNKSIKAHLERYLKYNKRIVIIGWCIVHWNIVVFVTAVQQYFSVSNVRWPACHTYQIAAQIIEWTRASIMRSATSCRSWSITTTLPHNFGKVCSFINFHLTQNIMICHKYCM